MASCFRRDDSRSCHRGRFSAHCCDRQRTCAAIGEKRICLEWSASELAIQRIPFRAYCCHSCIFRYAIFRELAIRLSVFPDSPAHRRIANVCDGALFVRRRVRGNPRSSLRVAQRPFAFRNPQSATRNRKLIGGGGGIRTHEAFRPAGFQDRSHQPLDHPSGRLHAPYFRIGSPMSKGT